LGATSQKNLLIQNVSFVEIGLFLFPYPIYRLRILCGDVPSK